MADIRIKDITTTATSTANDDYLAMDGSTNGTRKILADAFALSSSLATVATTGDYDDLTDTPSLATVATSGSYSDLTNKPSLATVATSGAYSDLTGKPSLATVATSGSYSDLTNKPTIKTYTISIASNVITLTDSSGGTSTATLPVYSGGVS